MKRKLSGDLLEPRILRLAWAAKAALVAEGTGGCTICPQTARSMRGIDMWAVSITDHEQRVICLTFDVLRAFIRRHNTILLGAERTYLGIWYDDEAGEFCLDVTKLFPDVAAASAFALAGRQAAMTNLRTLETVRLGQQERRAA